MIPSILLVAILGAQPQATHYPPTRDELVAEAVEHFDAQDLQGAIAAFERAYQLEHQAVDLYNIGRIYEGMGQPQKAREYYRRFLADPSLSPQERAEGKARLAALPAPAPVVAPPPMVVEPTPPAPEPEPEPTPKPRRHWTVITGATLLPVGAVALLAGGMTATSALGHARQAQQNATEQLPAQQTPEHEKARRQAMASDVLLAVGGTAVAAGATMLVVGLVREHRGRRDRTEQPRVAVTPAGAGLQLHVRF